MHFAPSPHFTQNWVTSKPSASGRRGIVVSQARSAAEAGVAVLDAGGNAVDAAVATALALAAVEPWNSGLGGIGFALVHRAGRPNAEVVDFGPVAPRGLNPALFKLTGRMKQDLFAWPEVENDANIHGPLSFAVPSSSAGYAHMHATWGRLPLAEVVAPAIALARRGLPQDWYTTLKVAHFRLGAAALRRERAHLSSGRPAARGALSGDTRLFPARCTGGHVGAAGARRIARSIRGRNSNGDSGRCQGSRRGALGGGPSAVPSAHFPGAGGCLARPHAANGWRADRGADHGQRTRADRSRSAMAPNRMRPGMLRSPAQ